MTHFGVCVVVTEGRANVTQMNTAFVMVTDGFRRFRFFMAPPFTALVTIWATPRQRDFRDGARIVKKREMSYKTVLPARNEMTFLTQMALLVKW